MLNLIIVHDHSSADIGQNCVLCYQHLLSNVSITNYNTHSLDGDSCDVQNVQHVISALAEAPFVFIAYCHGSDHGLTSHNHGNYVNAANSYFFSSSLFYTNACYSGNSIKDALIDNKCTSFVGYEDRVMLPNDEKDDIIFIQCENHAIVEFLNSDKEIGICVDEMKNKYTQQSQELVDQDRNVLAARLILNRDRLIIDGDKTVTRQSFT